MSTVRSNNSVGFVGDQRRINVAITRTKKKLIIVGNRNSLMQDSTWSQILDKAPRIK